VLSKERIQASKSLEEARWFLAKQQAQVLDRIRYAASPRFWWREAYVRGTFASRALGNVIVVRCLHCRHEASLSRSALIRFGLDPDAPISAFVKRLRCSKCGSGSVMAKRITHPIGVQDQRQRRA
jgi:hypothetical protein